MEFFWGARVTQAEDYVADVGNAAVHITQACLDPESKGSATLFAKTLRFQDAFPLCTLRAGQVDHCNLDHTFYPGDEKVQFTVRGKAAVCITGASRSAARAACASQPAVTRPARANQASRC